MSSIQELAMKKIDILYKNGEYTEALKGLLLVRKSLRDKEFHRIVDGLIGVILLEVKDSSGLLQEQDVTIYR